MVETKKVVYGKAMRRTIAPPLGPYSHAVMTNGGQAGRLLFIAGQIAIDKKGRVVSKNIADQYTFILEQIAAILKDAGGGLQDITKFVHYVVMDVSSKKYRKKVYPKLIEARKKFFRTGVYPVSTMVGVSSLMEKNALIEVDAIAVIPS